MSDNWTPIWFVILTSAAVGAVISSVITVIGQSIERRSREREMVLKSAIDHAWRYRDHLIEVSRDTGSKLLLVDPVVYVEKYYEWFDHLCREGKFPYDPNLQESKEKLEAESKQHREGQK